MPLYNLLGFQLTAQNRTISVEAAVVAPVLPGAARAARPLAGEAPPVAAPAPLLGADDPRTVVGAAAAAALSAVTGEGSKRSHLDSSCLVGVRHTGGVNETFVGAMAMGWRVGGRVWSPFGDVLHSAE